MQKALDLDPLSLPVNSLMANTYLWAGDYDSSAKQFQHTIELDPNFPMVRFFYASLLAEVGKYEQAIEEAQKGELLAGANPGEAAERATEFRRAFQDGGPKGYWQKNLEETLKQEAEAQYFPALDVAGAYAKVGNNEKTLEWLWKSFWERDGEPNLLQSHQHNNNLLGR